LRIAGSWGGHDLAWSPDGRWLAAGGSGFRPLLWDAVSGLPHGLFDESGVPSLVADPLERRAYYMYGVAFSRDGSRILSALTNGILLIWDADTGDLLTPRDAVQLVPPG
ncbi:MAG: WD40 repeat domain-containing protein, partial [Planctomycetota bacterium]